MDRLDWPILMGLLLLNFLNLRKQTEFPQIATSATVLFREERNLAKKIGTLHIGIMTHPGRNVAWQWEQPWIEAFQKSPFYGGIHYVSEEPVPNTTIPTILFNHTEFPHRKARVNESVTHQQAAKRILSWRHFVGKTDASFVLLTTDDCFIDVPNLKYLWKHLIDNNKTRKTRLMLGNCMWFNKYNKVVIQGGSGYFASRATAKLICYAVMQWFQNINAVEDTAFTRLVRRIQIKMRDTASEFFMGQYATPKYTRILQSGLFDQLPECEDLPVIAERVGDKCNVFLAPFNRVVVFHRLSRRKFKTPPIPPDTYPSNIYWYQNEEHPVFCRKTV